MESRTLFILYTCISIVYAQLHTIYACTHTITLLTCQLMRARSISINMLSSYIDRPSFFRNMWLFKLFPLLICALSILGMLVTPLSSSAIPQAILQDETINYLHRDNRLTQTANLYLVFEDSLLNDSNVLYQLQQVFFPFANHLNVARVPFNISIIVDEITNQGMNHPNTPFNCTRAVNGCIWPGVLIDWHPEVTADLYSDDLRQYVLSIHQKLKELEFISWSLLQLLAEFGQREDHPLVSFTLTVSSLPALPNKEDTTQALLSLMTWVSTWIFSPMKIYPMHTVNFVVDLIYIVFWTGFAVGMINDKTCSSHPHFQYHIAPNYCGPKFL